jgi:glutamine amidotransferase
VLAGVRSASVGMPVETTATPPFTTDRVLFGHNGFVPDASTLRSLLPDGAVPESRVDSALIWTLVQQRLSVGAELADALGDVVRAVTARTAGRLNLFLTDGQRLAATTWGDTLWYRRSDRGVLVASEPDDEPNGAAPWTELPDRSLLVVEQGRTTTAPLAQGQRIAGTKGAA